MNTIITIFLVAMLTLIPFAYYNKKDIKSNILEVIAFGILGIATTFFIIKYSNKTCNYLALLGTGLICSTFNYFGTKGNIEIKLVPKSLGILTLFFFSSLLQLLIIPFLNYDLNNLTSLQNLILTAFSDGILLTILLIAYFKDIKNDIKIFIKNINELLDIGVKYWLVGLGVMMVTNILIGILTNAKAVNEESVQELIHSAKFLAIITIGVIAPIIEELTFRKAFRDVFKNDIAFILASGLVFGALHVVLSLSSLWDLLYIIPYSSLGIAFAMIYVKTKNICVSTFMHIFHNTALTILSIIGTGVILLW